MTEKEAINVIRKEIDSFCESSEIDCFNSDCDKGQKYDYVELCKFAEKEKAE